MFSVGNTHAIEPNPKPSKSKPEYKNTHRWIMFVTLTKDKNNSEKFIKSVTYHLHPTFKPSVITINNFPFILSRIGWGYFTVELEVNFQSWTGLGPMKLSHELCFDDKGKSNSFKVELDPTLLKSKLPEQLYKDLTTN